MFKRYASNISSSIPRKGNILPSELDFLQTTQLKRHVICENRKDSVKNMQSFYIFMPENHRFCNPAAVDF